jgi:hypothetical protein
MFWRRVVASTLARLIGALVLSLALCGCHTTHRFGDARIRRNADFMSVTVDRFYLPGVPLGQVSTNVLQVRDLAFALYPTHVVVPITPREAELRENFPWDQTRLRIEFLDLAGTSFFSAEVALADASRGRSPGTYHQIELPFRHHEGRLWAAPLNLPQHTDYDVVVTVLEPSENPDHRAELYAHTHVR